jgi:hypothetical protein
MKRDIPDNVKRYLRKEVNFGCPVPDCGNPFLSWHHFDPPWHIKEHHNPEGMIALCTKHHPMADAGTFSKEQLQEYKRNPNSINVISTKFEWFFEKCLIRLGGCYAFDSCWIAIGDIKVLDIAPGESSGTTINFHLENAERKLLARMEDNSLETYTANVHDLAISASANRIKIWSDKNKVGFECHYSRKSPEEIERLITMDSADIPAFIDKPVPIENLTELYDELSEIDNILDLFPICMRRNDANGTMIRWHAAKHLHSDGRIPVIDFISCRFFSNGRCVEMRNGKLGSLTFCGGNSYQF